MDPRLLDHYNQELSHLRGMGAEFAQLFPKIAARLGMDGIEVRDPYVERLLEGFAFLAARVQVRLDAEFPRFTDRLLEICYPNFLAPMPAMLVAQFHPNLADPGLASGVTLPRGTVLRSQLVKGEETTCRFRTGQPVQLWPMEIAEAQYLPHVADLPASPLAGARKPRAGVRLRLSASGTEPFGVMKLETLRLHLSGQDETAYRLYERLLGHVTSVLVRPVGKAAAAPAWQAWLPASDVKEVGFEDDEALLPVGLRNFQGYRLLQEYFAFPQRFLFIDVAGLKQALTGRQASSIELVFLLDEPDAALEGVLGTGNFALHCAPAVNLFEHRCDRIHLGEGSNDYHVVPDDTQPMDYEVFEVLEVVGHGTGADSQRRFMPMYAAFHTESAEHEAYYCTQREPRLSSPRQRREGARSNYVGSEVFISLVDAREAPYSAELRQLAVRALCTNRDLPLHMPIGAGRTDLVLDISAPVEAIRVLKGPTRPSSRVREASQVWQFVSHLSLNHLSLSDTDPEQGAASLREMLGLYARKADRHALSQIEGIRHVRVQPTVRRLPGAGRITFGRGMEVAVEVDELAFQGASAFLLGAVLSRFFARYASMNAFTETSLHSATRGPVMRWGARCGSRATL